MSVDDRTGTETVLDTSTWAETTDLLVPGLTILWHPETSRIGERVALPALGAGRAVEIGRHAPGFLPAAGGSPRSLDDSRISRTPFLVAPVAEGLRIEQSDSRTPIEIDGEPLGAFGRDSSRTLEAAEIDRGVVLLLGRRVVLLLHRLDPVLPRDLPHHGLIGESPGMIQARREIESVADLDVGVLIRGETGTGKELVARALHDAGPRAAGPFVDVDMASLPPSLAAAELFGAVKGAFTGADRRRHGLMEQADGGTLFLDEIGETPVEVQPMLLRTLETRSVRPIGGETSTEVDTRIVAATDRDLERAVDDGSFRAPLLHRLAGYVIRLPPLRDRREDIGRLLASFLRRELAALGLEDRLDGWLPAPWVDELARADWPGNVRQLAHVTRRLVIANRDEEQAARFEGVDDVLAPARDRNADTGPIDARERAIARSGGTARRPSDVRESELLDALRAARWRPQQAADALGVARASIYELIDRSPNVRKASDLEPDEIHTALDAHGGSVEHAAEALEVSAQGLRRRIGQLGDRLERGPHGV